MHGNVLLCAFQFTALHDKLFNLIFNFFSQILRDALE